MSEYGYLACFDCGVSLWLGKAVKQPDTTIDYYLIGDGARNWQQPDVSRALWKMLADHTGHTITVIASMGERYQDWTAAQDTNGLFATIGGDGANDVPFDGYLAGWPG
jgi:hypothetical protein